MPTLTKVPRIPMSPSGSSVGKASQEIVPANVARTGLVITNTSFSQVYLAFGAHPATLNNGIPLNPGAVFTMDAFLFTT